MLEDPVGAAGGGFETAGCAVAGGVDAVFVIEVYLGRGVLVLVGHKRGRDEGKNSP